MMLNLINFIFSILAAYVSITTTESILQLKINYKSRKNIIIITFTTILIFLNNFLTIEYFKLLISFSILIFMNINLFTVNKMKIFFTVTVFQILVILYELILYFFVILLIGTNHNTITTSYLGIILFNLVTYYLIIITVSTKKNKFKNIKMFINNFALEIKRDYQLFLSFVIMLLFNIMIVNIYVEITYSIYIFLNIGMMFIITTILYRILVEKNKNAIIETKNKIYEVENESLINSLNEYEIVADKHRRDSHENNNQLNSIYLMLQSKSETSEVLDYIKSLQGTDKLADISNLKRTKRIPSGGLQGIIYQKIIHMDKKNIKNNLNISRDMKYFDFNKFNSDLMIDVCKILGVFLDNAIEEVITIENRIISIELFKLNNDFCISVKNTYTKSKDFSNIYDSGYSTKGKDRGFGLSLVKELATNNKRITHETVITDKYFTQTIKVKGMIKKS